ncbi:MAG: MATE family efflux transporter [Gammaproteobacteria bacterium]|nr:MATE family efflux transporter [Gammaproteobacteria bacterium]
MTIERQLDANARTTKRQRDAAMRGFTEGPVARHLIRLGSFMAMGSLSMNASMFAEAIYLGIIGTQALAAMGVAFPVTITLFAFAGGIGTGASSVTARTIGAGDREGAALLITHSQFLALGTGIVLGALGVMYAYDIVSLIGATGDLRDLTTEYLTVYLLGFPAFMLSIVGSTLLRATGNAKSPGIIMTAGSVLQIALGPPLIFGWFGIPGLGIAGAAWAYVISRTLGMGLYVVLLLRARMVRWSFVGMLDSWRRIMHVGGPAVASGLVMPAGMLIITRMLIGHGEAVVAGYNVASRVETLAHMILWSASSSVEPFVGQNWGARFYDRVKQALSLTHRFSLAWGVVTFVLMVLVGKSIVAVIDDNPTVIEVSVWFFYIIPLSIGFMGMTQIASSCFNALGKPTPSLVISLLRALVIIVPLAILGNYLFGYVGIFIATAITNVVVGLLAWQWNWRVVNRMSASGGGTE